MSRRAWLALVLLALPAALRPAYAQRSPEDELRSLQVPPGFEISLFAAEPLITNPAAIEIDTDGRVWVAQIQWYRASAKDPPADQIKVLEDTDGDGRADKATVFADGLLAPMSICVAGDKVYVATSPDLWVYRDQDGDLVADGPPEKLLTGFGGVNHDHGAHSLVLGPDHKWWMSHGDTGFNVTGTDGSHIEYRWGAMLRGELDGSQLETVAVNFRNPYEICVSSFGEAFTSDNDNDGNFSVRICWILEGGNYGWFGGPPAKVPPGTPFGEHWHFRGHIPGFVPATLVTGFGSPCGICFYEGDAFGPEYKDAPLHTDAGPREVRIYRHEKRGAGMQAAAEVFVASADDSYFRPDDICAAPDGSLYVADWYDGGVGGHAYNNPDQGRIFLLRPARKPLERIGKPGPYARVADALQGLKNPNLATQFLARERLLAEPESSVPALRELVKSAEPNFRARALWLLDRIGGDARQAVLDQLRSDDEAFRALAVRILRRHGEAYAGTVLALVDDPSAEVRRELLLALAKLKGEPAAAPLVKLASSYDGSDRYLLEAVNVAAQGRKPQLYRALAKGGQLSIDKIQLLQVLDPDRAADFLARSLAQTNLDESARTVLLQHLGGTASAEAGQAVLKLATDQQAAGDLRRLAIGLLSANLGGNWQGLKDQPELAAGVRQLLGEPDWQPAALALVGDHGLTQFAPEVLALAQQADLPLEVRRRAIQAAAQLHAEDAAQVLAELLASGDEQVGRAALAALVELQAWPAVKQVLSGQGVSAEFEREAAAQVMSSTAGALVLLRMIDEESLSDSVRQAAIALAATHPDSNIRVLFERFIPEDQRPKRLGSVIQPAEILALEADSKRGEEIFFQSSAAQCKTCHRVHGTGGALGPDLSQIGKKYERAALLETILDPSKAIAPEYVPYLLETEGGRVYAGFVVERTDDLVVLKDANGNLVRVPAAEVAAFEPQKKSLMPELVLRDVTAQDAADLLGYLASLDQAPAIAAAAGEWQAGAASVVITPDEPTWLSGYSNRTRPAEGKVHDLYAKALAVESADGTRLVLVTLDLGSVSPRITDAVSQRCTQRHQLPRGSLVLNASHTHCAPEVAAERLVFHDLAAEEEAKLVRYIDGLQDKLVELVGAALGQLRPARLAISHASADFARNRRLPTPEGFVNQQNDQGVVDHDVPVLRVTGLDGKLRAVLFGYACHNTTLAFYQYCGDYAGFAQQYVEEAHPGTTALFMMGCGGDQNPYPRHGELGLEHCRRHGRALADAVEQALAGELGEVHGPLRVAFERTALDLEPLPPLEELRTAAESSSGHPQRKAKYLLEKLDREGKIDLTQTCPIHAARFGDELLLVAISGETVVDYSLACKAAFAGPLVWVAGYNDDVFAYLPSLRVLREGGYEGRTGIVHQLVPTPFAPSVEDRVLGTIERLVKQVSP